MILTYFLFLFLLCGIHFLLCCPQRGLCRSDQFHCYNIRQSNFGSILTGRLWISKPHFSEHQSLVSTTHTRSRWQVLCFEMSPQDIMYSQYFPKETSSGFAGRVWTLASHCVTPFLQRVVNLQWRESDWGCQCTRTHRKSACFGTFLFSSLTNKKKGQRKWNSKCLVHELVHTC